MKIKIGEKYELRKLDSSNWQLWEFTVIKGRDGISRKEWKPLQAFFGKAVDAVPIIMDRYAAAKDADMTVKTFAKWIREATHELANAVEAVDDGS